jgi:DNA modification methylase
MGSGTTGIVARKLNRNYIGIDLGYEEVRNWRLEKELGMFN